MTLEERVAKRLEATKRRLDGIGREEVIWKRRLADAVLSLISEGRAVTPDALRTRLVESGKSSTKILGTDFSIETSRVASETAIAHLEEAVAMSGEKKAE